MRATNESRNKIPHERKLKAWNPTAELFPKEVFLQLKFPFIDHLILDNFQYFHIHSIIAMRWIWYSDYKFLQLECYLDFYMSSHNLHTLFCQHYIISANFEIIFLANHVQKSREMRRNFGAFNVNSWRAQNKFFRYLVLYKAWDNRVSKCLYAKIRRDHAGKVVAVQSVCLSFTYERSQPKEKKCIEFLSCLHSNTMISSFWNATSRTKFYFLNSRKKLPL